MMWDKVPICPHGPDDGSVVGMGYEIKRERPSRVRETAPAYGDVDADMPIEVPPLAVSVTVAERGRLVLPAEVRERLHIRDGDRLALVVDPDGTIRLQTGDVLARSLLGAYKHLSPRRRAVDELIKERRREAAMEERDTRALVGPRRRRRAAK
jgi:AbrB family looped-hinge helix DNA binding protein